MITNTIYHPGMTLEEVQCMLHEDYLHIVDQLDMPLWYYEQYKQCVFDLHSMYQQDQEVDNRFISLEDLSEEDLKKVYSAMEEDVDYLCLLNGLGDDNHFPDQED